MWSTYVLCTPEQCVSTLYMYSTSLCTFSTVWGGVKTPCTIQYVGGPKMAPQYSLFLLLPSPSCSSLQTGWPMRFKKTWGSFLKHNLSTRETDWQGLQTHQHFPLNLSALQYVVWCLLSLAFSLVCFQVNVLSEEVSKEVTEVQYCSTHK